MVDLSILIPSRNEQFLSITVESILKNIRGNTEVIVVLDGAWADPPLLDDKRIKIIYNPVSIGQRAATNQACKLAKGKWVMKIDAHCAVDEGFDVKVIDGVEDNWTIVPIMYNHHAFNWRCKKCGNTWYQGPTPIACKSDEKTKHPQCDNKTDFVKDIVWKPRLNRKNEFYRFDTTLHFQYHSIRKKEIPAHELFAETMSLQGSCFVLTREKYWELNICDEAFGSWGQQGTEVACKTWLSGGKCIVNRKTWYSHMFRTQGGDFGFPYPLSQNRIEHARRYCKELFFENTWEKQIYPLSWLIAKFYPLNNHGRHKNEIPDWHSPEGSSVLKYVMEKGIEFYKKQLLITNNTMVETTKEITAQDLRDKIAEIKNKESNLTKEIIFFTDNQLNVKIAHKVQKQLISIGLPIISVSLKSMKHFGSNIHLPLKRGYLTMFKQILAGLEASKADIVYLCEHDVLYPKEHFEFTPPTDDLFYYNVCWWKVRQTDGFAVSWEAPQVSGVVAYRKLLLEHYRKRVSIVEKYGYNHSMGFEPGSHNYKDEVKTRDSKSIPQDIYIDDVCFETFKSSIPYIDIRTEKNLSYSKWSLDDFRNKTTAKNFKIGWLKDIEGWNLKAILY